ncbi:NDR1/HIN1-like protein 13 [Tasmannia lanceolata]|uniref:NDR1/HIN1-like protein 13 n=1 Tax=Tasmannia lanceolata TaxID=3420 RepID=UPI0040646BB4
MADKIHPAGDSPSVAETSTDLQEKPLIPQKPNPPPGTYVIQIPKDQIYRLPPPENSRRHQSGRSKSRRSFCCCLSWIFCIFFLIILLIALAAGILYLIFRPKIPNYSVDSVSIKGFNLSSSDLTFSPEFDVTVMAENPNKKIGIYYLEGSSVTVWHSDVELCNGVLPTFYQGTKNVTVFKTVLKGEGIRVSSSVESTLMGEQNRGQIPLELDLDVPVKIKFGAVKTWTITVKVRCDVTVDKLTENSKIVSKDCNVKVKL